MHRPMCLSRLTQTDGDLIPRYQPTNAGDTKKWDEFLTHHASYRQSCQQTEWQTNRQTDSWTDYRQFENMDEQIHYKASKKEFVSKTFKPMKNIVSLQHTIFTRLSS